MIKKKTKEKRQIQRKRVITTPSKILRHYTVNRRKNRSYRLDKRNDDEASFIKR